MELSIVIVNYNGAKYINDCLSSLRKNLTVSYEVIIVDNASTDDSLSIISKIEFDYKLIKSEINLGFSQGNNLGAEHASGEFLLLLNNDTILLSDLSEVIALMKKDTSIGIVGGCMYGANNEYRCSVGYFPDPHRLLKLSSLHKKKGPFKKGDFDFKARYPVDWVEGSLLLTRHRIWVKLKGLDPEYFMYVEDVDYAKRVSCLNYKILFIPSVKYIHYGGYGAGRVGLLISGLRRYHRHHSGHIRRVSANLVLDFGLVLRVPMFLVLSLFKPKYVYTSWNCLKAIFMRNS